MDAEHESQILRNQYRSLLSILHSKGLSTDAPTDEEFETMTDADKARWVRQLRDLSRTPTD